MKPSWSNAPEWAAYLARDADGLWFWYEVQPVWIPRMQAFTAEGRGQSAQAGYEPPGAVCEARPKVHP